MAPGICFVAWQRWCLPRRSQNPIRHLLPFNDSSETKRKTFLIICLATHYRCSRANVIGKRRKAERRQAQKGSPRKLNLFATNSSSGNLTLRPQCETLFSGRACLCSRKLLSFG